MPLTGVAGPDRPSLGENSRALVGGVPGSGPGTGTWWLRFVTGSVGAGAAENDVTDNMSLGFGEASRGPRLLELDADCLWRALDNPLGKPPQFEIGEHTPRIIVWPDFANDPNQYYKAAVWFCRGHSLIMASQGNVTFTLRLRTQGPFYYPARPDPAGVYG